MAIVNYDVQQYRQTPEHTTGVIQDYSDAQNIERIGQTLSQFFQNVGGSFAGGKNPEPNFAGFNEEVIKAQDKLESRNTTPSERNQIFTNLSRVGLQYNLTPTQIEQVFGLHGFGSGQAWRKVVEEQQEAAAEDTLSIQQATRRAATTQYPGLPVDEAERFYQQGLNDEFLTNAQLGTAQAQDQAGAYSVTTHRALQAKGASLVASNVHALAQQTQGRITREALDLFRKEQEEQLIKRGFSASDATMAVALGTQGLTSIANDQYENSEQVLKSVQTNREILEQSSAQEFFTKSFKMKDGSEISATQLFFLTDGFKNEIAWKYMIGNNPELLDAIVNKTEVPVSVLHSLSSTDVNLIWRNGTSIIKSLPQGGSIVNETISGEADKQLVAPAKTQGPARASGLKVATEQLSQLDPTDMNSYQKQAWKDGAISKSIEMYASGLFNQLQDKGYYPQDVYPRMENGDLKFYMGALPGSGDPKIIDITNEDRYTRAGSNGSYIVAEDRGTILRARQEFVRNGLGSGEDFDNLFNKQVQKYFPAAQLHDPSKVSSRKAEGSSVLAMLSDFVEGGANAIVESPGRLAQWGNELLGTSGKAQQAFARAEEVAGNRVQVEELPPISQGPTDEERFEAAQSSARAEATEALIDEDGPYNQNSLPSPLQGGRKTEKFVKKDIVLTGEPGQEVKSPVTGTVLFSGQIGGKGPHIAIIQDTSIRGGKIWGFSEMSSSRLERGNRIKEGEVLGTTNKQGKVRIELRDKGKRVDPSKYFSE